MVWCLRDINALRGLEEFSHIWIIWQFSENTSNECFPTVRPPRLGGDERVGVFATRSPYRPNSLGMSCVEINSICLETNEGPIIYVNGADLMDGTPIYDIKPYIPYTDCIPKASCSFAKSDWERKIKVDFPKELLQKIPEDKHQSLIKVLEQDPRPAYKEDSDQIYGLRFANYNISFTISNKILSVIAVETESA